MPYLAETIKRPKPTVRCADADCMRGVGAMLCGLLYISEPSWSCENCSVASSA